MEPEMTEDELKKDQELADPEIITGDMIGFGTPGIAEAGPERVAGPRGSAANENQRFYVRYIFLPLLFLTVALLGGMRLSGVDGSFIFLKPALLCLVFASILLVLFFRAGLIRLDGWFNESFPMRKNIANAAVLLSVFAATTQLFNSLIPEQGLPYWIVSFCFFWSLSNNLFADFDTKKLLRSLGGIFGLAFVTKYLVLADLAAPAGRGWLRSLIENPAQQAMTWALDLPQFSAGTGYIQFFVMALFLLGLYMLPPRSDDTSPAANG
jgi:hypothetical protein